MDRSELQATLKRLCNVMWEANVTNPITYVTQISYLLFLKMLEEIDTEQKEAGNGRHRSLFGTFEVGKRKLDFEPLRWSVLASDPDNERMLHNLRDKLPLMAEHPLLSQAAHAVFQNASVVIPNGAALRRAVDIITPISFVAVDADVKGDLFEILVNHLGSQKRAAQFRTPRHLIRVITQMVDPKIGETVCDPACGSGGFLIAAYQHILLANSSPELIKETIAPDGLLVRRGIGDKLKRAQLEFLQKGTLHGFEGDPDILRLSAMNSVLHQFDQSPLVWRDSICGSEDRWDEVQFDVILENPPFSGKRGDAKRSLRVEKGDKYVLFLAHALRSLRPGGRAGIIFPNGMLFGNTGSHLQVKKRLLEEFDLQAVVTLPKGMFEPYTPNPTCFLVFQKTGKPTKQTWFYRVEGDGSSLSTARKFSNRYPNNLSDLLAKWPMRETEDGRAWRVPAERIIQNNYNMTLTGLGLIVPEKVDHLDPREILESVAAKEPQVFTIIREMRDLLLKWKVFVSVMLPKNWTGG
jgi:type I restriction enzyme M protein